MVVWTSQALCVDFVPSVAHTCMACRHPQHASVACTSDRMLFVIVYWNGLHCLLYFTCSKGSTQGIDVRCLWCLVLVSRQRQKGATVLRTHKQQTVIQSMCADPAMTCSPVSPRYCNQSQWKYHTGTCLCCSGKGLVYFTSRGTNVCVVIF